MARIFYRKDRKGRKVWYIDYSAPDQDATDDLNEQPLAISGGQGGWDRIVAILWAR